MQGNKGLAHALKLGCNLAISDGFDYALTMDQDSYFEKEAVSKLIEYIKNEDEKSAIVCPNVKALYYDKKKNKEFEAYTLISDRNIMIKQWNWVMTSGSMTNLHIYTQTQGFDENLFIAHIDIEYGIQVRSLGYKITMLCDSIIYQHFGNSVPRKILWKTVHPSFALPIRTYYLFRNQQYLKLKYGNKIQQFMGVKLWKFIVKIILFEDKKTQKIIFAIKGIYDAYKNNMGEYNKKH